MEESLNPTVNIGPISFDLTLLAMSLVTVLMVFAFVYWASRKMTIRPKGKQNALEMIYDFVIGFTKPNIGESYIKDYSLFLFSLFLFILVANNIGLMAKVQTTNGYNLWTSPTANLGYDLSLSFLITLIALLEEFTNFASLAIRIYGNIFAGEVLAGLLLALSQNALYWYPFAFIANMLWTAFSIFISCIQAYVFTMLSSMYIGKKINEGEE